MHCSQSCPGRSVVRIPAFRISLYPCWWMTIKGDLTVSSNSSPVIRVLQQSKMQLLIIVDYLIIRKEFICKEEV